MADWSGEGCVCEINKINNMLVVFANICYADRALLFGIWFAGMPGA